MAEGKSKHGGRREPPGGRPRNPAKTEIRPPKPTPLEYMLAVMNDNNADVSRRDRMAIAAAPYVHGHRIGVPPGKKDIAQEKSTTAGLGSEWGEDLKIPEDRPN